MSGRRTDPSSVSRWVLGASILASSMAFIDGSVVNLALPTLQANLDASPSAVQWVVEVYTLALAGLVLVGGALGDRYGRRRMFAVGIVAFAATSVACGLAGNAALLIAARAAQGLGAALLVPGSLALINAHFDDEARGRAFGTWSAVTAITAAVGPVLGGWLISISSWRAVFFINVPLAAVTLWITLRRIPEPPAPPGEAALDLPGAALITGALLLLTYGLIAMQSERGLVPAVAMLASVPLLAAFILVESRTKAPMVPLELFRSRDFVGTNLLTLFVYAALGGAFFFIPFELIKVHGYSSARAGWALLPFILLMSLLSRASGWLLRHVGTRRLLGVGPLISAAGFVLFAFGSRGGSYVDTFLPGCIALGLGMGLTVAPLTTTVMASVPSSHSGLASGINNAVARAAGLLAIAGFGILGGGSLVAGWRPIMFLAAALAATGGVVAYLLGTGKQRNA